MLVNGIKQIITKLLLFIITFKVLLEDLAISESSLANSGVWYKKKKICQSKKPEYQGR